MLAAAAAAVQFDRAPWGTTTGAFAKRSLVPFVRRRRRLPSSSPRVPNDYGRRRRQTTHPPANRLARFSSRLILFIVRRARYSRRREYCAPAAVGGTFAVGGAWRRLGGGDLLRAQRLILRSLPPLLPRARYR